MLTSFPTEEQLTTFNYTNVSSNSTPERDTRRLDDNLLPSITRTISQSSSLSCNSSMGLVPDSHPIKEKRSFSKKIFGWNSHKEKLHDSEKNSDPLHEPAEERRGDDKEPHLKPWYGWKFAVLSWANILLVFIPGSWILNATTSNSHTLVFVFCILAMIPLVKMHDLATKELSARLGGNKTGLLNASMSNIVEIVIAIMALRKCELRVVQASLVGSMLSKLLLILGMCFFAGGMRFTEQDFDSTATQIHSSLLSISVGAVLLPAAFHFALTYSVEDSLEAGTSLELQKRDILRMSHGVAIVLLFIYASYLLFQFWSHTHLFQDNTTASNKLPQAVSVRSIASRIRRKSGISISSPNVSSPKPKYRTAPSQDTLATITDPCRPGAPSGKGPYMYRQPILPSLSDVTNMTPTKRGTKQVNAYLMSPYGTTSQVTVTSPPEVLIPTNSSAEGSTVRLVQSPEAISLPNSVPVRRRRASSARSWTENSGRRTSGRRSPVDEAISAYLSSGKTGMNGEGRWDSTQYHRKHAEEPQRESSEDESGDDGKNDNVEGSEGVAEKCREPQMSWTLTLVLLTLVTVAVAANAELMVDTMDELSDSISKEWIGLILLPAVGSLAECITAINVSVKDQLTLSISVAVGSTIQTALFVIPFMVLLGWVLDKPLALLFDPFESVVLYISVHTMGYVVADGRSNWLEGVILVCLYIVIAVTFWFYPGSSFSSNLAVCSTSVL